MKPLTNTVGDLQAMIRHEDKGVDRVACLSTGMYLFKKNYVCGQS